MQYKSESPILEACVRGKRQMHMAAVLDSPGRLPEFIQRNRELLPAFAAYYIHLRALPRRVRRALQGQWRLPLAGVALMLALEQTSGLAATIPVNASCTLIDAITAANTDTATGACPAGSGTDSIRLPTGSTQTLAVANSSYHGPNGLPFITSVVTIEGQGSTIVRDSGAPEFRILEVSNIGNLTLIETTVSGGVTAANLGGVMGGGIRNNGTLTLVNCTISGNSVGGYGGGGGVATYYGSVAIVNSLITGNVSGNRGGVTNYFGTVTVRDSSISKNSVTFGGGGIINFGTVAILNSSVSDNEGLGYRGAGGGMVNFGTAMVLNSTISGNSVSGFAGGIVNQGENLTVINSTISSNSASSPSFGGGGIVNHGLATLHVLNSTITRNSTAGFGGGVVNYGGTFTLAGSLVSGNTAATASEIAGGAFADNQNLFGVNGNAGVDFTPGATDIVPAAGVQLGDILKPMLAFNGGPTQTHALVPGSPAIDAGGPACTDAKSDPLLTDQRGKPRLIDGNRDGKAACDIGAFEFFPLVNEFVTLDSPPDTAFDPTRVADGPAGTFTITATFTNTSSTPLRFPFFTVTELSGRNLLLNAEEQGLGVGATVTPDVGDRVLSPRETVRVDFAIGLQAPTPFTFFVDLFGEPLISANGKSQQRQNVMTKTGQR